MKAGTESKLKFKQLMLAFSWQVWQAAGLLDTLWKFVAHNCPRGDIGRFSIEEIAVGIDYRGDAHELIDTLVRLRWLDRVDENLRVHDWSQHCEDSVHKNLARLTETFIDGTFPSLNRFTQKERAKYIAAYEVKYGKAAM